MQIGVEHSKAIDNKRVFIVDEDEIFRAALQFMLHDDYEAHELTSVDAAISKAAEWRPDLVIVAEKSLRVEGLGVIAVLKSILSGVKILALVDADNAAFGVECVSAGADGYISKPLRIEFVRQKVDALIGRRKGVTIPLTVLQAN